MICILGETLEPLDSDGIIPAYGFGDFVVKDKGIFPLKLEVCIIMLIWKIKFRFWKTEQLLERQN